MEQTRVVTDQLQVALAESYALYLKTQNYHWNVTGHQFGSLHSLFEEQYTDLAEAIDEIAERVRALGVKTPASFQRFSDLSTITDGDEHSDADTMVKSLAHDNTHIANFFKSVITLAQEAGDEATADLLIERVRTHEKNAWMLNSSL